MDDAPEKITEPFLHLLKVYNDTKLLLKRNFFSLTKVSYEKGSRAGDYDIRDKVKLVNHIINSYYEAISTCEVSEDTKAPIVEEVIIFFIKNYLDRFTLEERIEALKDELIHQIKMDVEHNLKFGGEQGKQIRSVENDYRNELQDKISTLQKEFSLHIKTLLISYLNILNDTLLFLRIRDKVFESFNKNVFVDDDESYDNFSDGIQNFINFKNKINNYALTKEEALKYVNKHIKDSGFKRQMLSLKNMAPQKLKDIITISVEVCCIKPMVENEELNKRSESLKEVIEETDLNKVFNKSIYDKLKDLIKDLCYVDKNSGKHETGYSVEGEKIDKNARFLFHTVGNQKNTLKVAADAMRDLLIVIDQFLFAALKKNSRLKETLNLLIQCVADQMEFTKLFKEAYETAFNPKNQATSFLGEVKQYISKELAQKLKDNILNTCNKLNEAFTKTLYEFEIHPGKETDSIKSEFYKAYDTFYADHKKIKSEVARLKSL